MFVYKCSCVLIKFTLLIVIVVNNSYCVVERFNAKQYNQIKINFLRDFVQQEVNVRYTMYLCWPRGDLIHLRRTITDRQIAFITSENYFLNDDSTDNQLIRVLDLNCPNMKDILQIANATGYFIFPNRWILIQDLNNDPDEINDTVEMLNFYADSDIILAKMINTSFIDLKQPYKYNNQGSKTVYENYGFWTSDDGIKDERRIKVISHRRENLHKTIINASFVATDPDTPKRLNDYRYFHVDSITKHSVIVTKLIAECMNGTLNLKPIDSWGRKLPNGTWTGIMYNIINHIDHFSGTGMLLFPERNEDVKYLTRNAPTRVGVVFRKPPLSFAKNILRLSFQHWVWISIFLLMLLSLVIMRFSFSQEITVTNKDSENNINVVPLESEWTYISMFLIGGFCQQGAEIEPRGFSGRIVTIFIYLAMMFIYTSYSANIVALLQSSSDTINSLSDITNSRLQAGVINLEYGRTMFQKTTDPNRKLFYEKKVGPNGFYTYSEGIEKMRQGLFAFVLEVGPGYHYIAKMFRESEKCDLKEMGLGQLDSTFVIVPKRSPYIEIIKVAVVKFEERGLQQKIFLTVYKKKPPCLNAGANFVAVGINECYWAFLIWCAGTGIGVFIFAFEILFKKLRQKWKLY